MWLKHKRSYDDGFNCYLKARSFFLGYVDDSFGSACMKADSAKKLYPVDSFHDFK